MMVVNIAVGGKFPQHSLLYKTNKYLLKRQKFRRKRKIFTKQQNNYVVEVNHKWIKMLIADNIKEQEVNFLKSYIEYMFSGGSIGVYLREDIGLFDEINNVEIHMYLE